MGYMYKHGSGVNQGCSQAMNLPLKLAEQGLPRAHSIIGNMHSYGLGVAQDFSLALEWTARLLIEERSLLSSALAYRMSLAREWRKAKQWQWSGTRRLPMEERLMRRKSSLMGETGLWRPGAK